eukprot:134875-Chlamydomonas_euryale.AAC.9
MPPSMPCCLQSVRAAADEGGSHAGAPALTPAQQQQPSHQQFAVARFCKGPGKQCVECGATSTPQWREGPVGPKTLCNACGVRYNRLRSSKRNGTQARVPPRLAKQGKPGGGARRERAASRGSSDGDNSSPERPARRA